ncbi:hypothetical protein CDV25_00190 [Helicobacter apodemus]|uniref:Uncharacterized protein n=1 Tax=Helicobacter apodemus TaxID=135569 RepID=A0A2U8FB15_9HELI|nr:hypothetical protein CDV25_00190 [Helicobacter apodemus]
MVRIRDYAIPILLYTFGQSLVTFAFFVSNTFANIVLIIGKFTNMESLLVAHMLHMLGYLFIGFCTLYYFYKKQMLDMFIGIIIALNSLTVCFYIMLALLLFHFMGDGV